MCVGQHCSYSSAALPRALTHPRPLYLDVSPLPQDHDSNRSVFALISEVPNSSPKKTRMMWIALGLLIIMITVQVVQDLMAPKIKWIDLWPAATITGVIMIIIRCMTWDQAKRSMDA